MKEKLLSLLGLTALATIVLAMSVMSKQNKLGANVNVPQSFFSYSTVSCGGSGTGATTSVFSAGAYQHVYLDNLGTGNVYLAFGTADATSTKGFHLYPVGSSSVSARDIIDPSLLAKGANCIGTPTSSVNVFTF